MQVLFDPTHFAQGRFRLAFKGVYSKPPSKRGKEVVVKKSKGTCTWYPSDWDTTKKIHEKAAELAQGFNQVSKPRYPICFTEISIIKVTSRPSPSAARLGECLIVEDFIEGEFKKWCSNYGYISTESQTMPAFMHWSWVHTRGELMVADLQGVLKPGGFFLTDPVIMSLNYSYGQTDTGAEGMIMFFYHHKCNELCQHLPKPTINDFLCSVVPFQQLDDCTRKLAQLQAATTFTSDLSFNPYTRRVVASVLRRVAVRK